MLRNKVGNVRKVKNPDLLIQTASLAVSNEKSGQKSFALAVVFPLLYTISIGCRRFSVRFPSRETPDDLWHMSEAKGIIHLLEMVVTSK